MKKIIILLIFIMTVMFLNAQTENTDKPLKGDWNLKMKKIWEVDEAGDMAFGRIRGIKSGENGNVYILDSKNYKIHIFSRDGEYISSFGKKGEGPGEIKNLRYGAKIFIPEKNIIVTESGGVHYFSPEGKFLKSITIPQHIKPRIFISDNLLISAPQIVQNTKNGEAFIKSFNIKTEKEVVLEKFIPYKKASDSRTGRDGSRVKVGIVISTITPMMITNHKNGNLIYGMSNIYRINKINLKSGKKIIFSIEGRKREGVSKDYKKQMGKRFANLPIKMVNRILDGLPKTFSYYRSLQIVKNGLVLVFLSNSDDKTMRPIDIFSSEGKYLYQTEIKVENRYEIRIFYLENNTLLQALEDEDGELKLVKYTIALPVL